MTYRACRRRGERRRGADRVRRSRRRALEDVAPDHRRGAARRHAPALGRAARPAPAAPRPLDSARGGPVVGSCSPCPPASPSVIGSRSVSGITCTKVWPAVSVKGSPSGAEEERRCGRRRLPPGALDRQAVRRDPGPAACRRRAPPAAASRDGASYSGPNCHPQDDHVLGCDDLAVGAVDLGLLRAVDVADVAVLDRVVAVGDGLVGIDDLDRARRSGARRPAIRPEGPRRLDRAVVGADALRELAEVTAVAYDVVRADRSLMRKT